MHAYRTLTPETFWSKFSFRGKRLSVTGILKKMRSTRLAEDKDLANRARLEYGDRFQDIFWYRKGSTSGQDNHHLVMQKPCAIAKHYRERHGLLPDNYVGADHFNDDN